jgi:hypothetical protein
VLTIVALSWVDSTRLGEVRAPYNELTVDAGPDLDSAAPLAESGGADDRWSDEE